MTQVPASSHGLSTSGGTVEGNVLVDGATSGVALEVVGAMGATPFDVFRVRNSVGNFLIEVFSDGGTTFQSDDAAIEALWVQHLKPAASVDAFVVADTSGNRKLRVAVNGNIGFYGQAPVAQPAAIANAAGGVVIDAEARAALNTLLAAARTLGLIAT
jgi:hypothetical protein